MRQRRTILFLAFLYSILTLPEATGGGGGLKKIKAGTRLFLLDSSGHIWLRMVRELKILAELCMTAM